MSVKGDGATLVATPIPGGGGTQYVYRAADGSTITYKSVSGLTGLGHDPSAYTIQMASTFCNSGNATDCALPVQMIDPDGSSYTLTWHVPTQCYDATNPDPWNVSENPGELVCSIAYRLTDVRSKSSYAMKIKYQSNFWPIGSPAPHTD